MSVIYYKKELDTEPSYSFNQLKTGIAMKIIPNSPFAKTINIEDYLSIENIYWSIRKHNNGSLLRQNSSIEMHKCQYEDFFNELNDSMDINSITNN